MRRLAASWLQIVVLILVLLPLAGLARDFATGQLTANPVEEIQLRTGRYALTLLVLTLACKPVYNVLGSRQALLLRRPLGLYGAAYAGLHFLNFVGLDYGFDLPLMWADIAGKRFVLVGFAAFLILLALAVTSSQGWRRRLGKNWRRLHRLIYAAGLLAALHFVWQAKLDLRVPLIYAGVIVLLLILRIPKLADNVRIRGRGARGQQVKQSLIDET